MATKKDSKDSSSIKAAYPDVSKIFSVKLKPLQAIKDSCLVVLDTNTLLVPYTVSKESLQAVEATYSHLAEANRLIVPGQVAREFVSQRPQKLTELYSQLQRRAFFIKRDTYPLLESFEAYRELTVLEEKMGVLAKEHQQKVNELLKHVRGWQWDDPVSKIYTGLFADRVVVDLKLDDNELGQELQHRQNHQIPPGYKDSAKTQNAAGDLIIWKTILQVAKQQEKDVLFITSEEKADWWHRSENRSLYPRFELIDEFQRATDGKSFHMAKLSELLELFGVANEAVEQVSREEVNYVEEHQPEHDYSGYIPSEVEFQGMVKYYLSRSQYHGAWPDENKRGTYPQLLTRIKNLEIIGAEYQFVPGNMPYDSQMLIENWNKAFNFLKDEEFKENEDFQKVSSLDLVVATDTEEHANKLAHHIGANTSKYWRRNLRTHICFLYGTQDIFIRNLIVWRGD